jgi:hypothetical protein
VRRVVGTLAVLSLAAHLIFLPPTLEDLDSVNFALGVRQFDVSRHQPHPPGYPMFIALGKIGTSVLGLAGVSSPEVRGLAIWSAVAAGVLPLFLFVFFRSLTPEPDDRRAAIATVLATCAPLFWFTGVRPLSDLAGLAAAGAALAALGSDLVFQHLAFRRAPSSQNHAENREGIRPHPNVEIQDLTPKLAGAFLAGLSIGFRSQMALLTLPLLVVVLVARPTHRWKLLAAALAGVAVWAVPLIVLSGGPFGYIRALGSQAGEDFTGVVMLWTNRTVRVALAVFLQSFVRPWDSPILAGVMLSLATAGALSLVKRSPKTLFLVLVTFGPYAVFHILFQETVTTRYAVPLIPLVAYLAATALTQADPRASAVCTAAIAGMSLTFAVPAMTSFASVPSPIFNLLSEMRLLQGRGAKPIVGMHRRVFTESRRARVYAGEVPGTLLPATRDYEWLELTRAWREGHDGETWFVADPRRTDLALIDREHTRTREYRWPLNGKVYVGGARPDELDWHVITDPGWFLEQGWALTPEVAGISDRDGWGPHRRPSIGWVRRRPAPALMMIGGRHLGADPPVRIIVNVDEKAVATLEVRPGFFLDFVDLPAGTFEGSGKYAKLTVSATSTGSGPAPPVAIEQFNLQSPDRTQFGFDEGWFEPEYNPATARSWRWMSERAIVRVHAPGHGVVLRINGESPLRYFDGAPQLRISAGDRLLSEIRPTSDFAAEVQIPADALAAAGGRILMTSDRAYVPGEREGTGDRRRLALRVYSVTVEPKAP